MTDLERYERISDPGEPFEPTKAHTRRQRQAVDIREAAARFAADAPPLSEETIVKVAELFRVATPPTDLMHWQLRLYCGHELIRRAHHTHETVHAAFMGSARCEQCGLDPATIVAAQAIGRVEEPARSPVRSDIDQQIKRHERAIERHQRELDRLRDHHVDQT